MKTKTIKLNKVIREIEKEKRQYRSHELTLTSKYNHGLDKAIQIIKDNIIEVKTIKNE